VQWQLIDENIFFFTEITSFFQNDTQREIDSVF
jgi:hypothetical protein